MQTFDSVKEMETLNSQEPANYDEIAMQQSLHFSDSLKDLKNLRKQLYAAAEYFELSYTNDDQKQLVVDTLKEYAIKALVNTVDHLGAVSCKLNDLLGEKVNEVSQTDLRVSCIQQRIGICQGCFDHEGLAEQSSLINTPKYHKRYVLPVGETMKGGIRTKSKYQGCSLEDEDDWHEYKNAVRATIRETTSSSFRKGRSPSPSTQQRGSFAFAGTVTRKDLDKRSVSPRKFPLLRTGSLSSRPITTSSRPNSRPKTPNPSRPTTPTSIGRQRVSEYQKSVSMRVYSDRDTHKETDQNHQTPRKSKRLLKALLSRRKFKKDDMLDTYLDEY
ncbi:hypothetical protein L1987_71068 [Smallanthus sonchifolius]|uniref:Uncharacterized protein n=1 Tax=Smallanthus sonchifolius TaxID=185202 RepID=A0ACB9AVQ1_9ASTR|nr:hypothetical protein L1987_71068 [Smallanthus sonchifolius]